MIESGQASTTERLSLLLPSLRKHSELIVILLSKAEQCNALCYFLFQHALIAFPQYAIVIKNNYLDLLEGTKLKWAMGTKRRNQKTVLLIM